MKTKEAFDVLKKAMHDDPSYAHSWHCNVAMSFFDAMPDPVTNEFGHKMANEGATRFMRLCFGVETAQHPKERNEMKTCEYPENDLSFEDHEIKEIKDTENYWQISVGDYWLGLDKSESSLIPEVGMKARLYGGFGYPVRGVFLNGDKFYYRTEEEQKIHNQINSYGKDAKDWLARWDKGDSVWSIEMGGMGPGYEQAIQITAAELLRFLLEKKYDIKSWEDEATSKRDRDEIHKASLEIPKIKDLGLSGAQYGAALNIASMIYNKGPVAVMTDERVEDRKIQVSKNFPRG